MRNSSSFTNKSKDFDQFVHLNQTKEEQLFSTTKVSFHQDFDLNVLRNNSTLLAMKPIVVSATVMDTTLSDHVMSQENKNSAGKDNSV